VDAVWLSPIHPSPDRDLGYDVTDYVPWIRDSSRRRISTLVLLGP
jgi:Alpha amylase, catalytic domain